MRHLTRTDLACLWLATCLVAVRAAEPPESCLGGTGRAADGSCVPACSATWEERTSSRPEYTLECEYACARGRDSWHAPSPACRCRPPSGAVYVKKRLYKADGEPQVERVPKYDVTMVPGEACDRPGCRGGCAGHDSLEGLPWIKRLLATP